MNTTVNSITNELGLDKVNENFAKGYTDTSGRMAGLVKNAAESYVKAFGDTWWNRLEEKSETGRAIRACKKDLYTRLKARDCANPSVYWSRILTAAGKPDTPRVPHPHTPEQRITDEVGRLVRALNKVEGLNSKVLEARRLLMQALGLFGVEIEAAA